MRARTQSQGSTADAAPPSRSTTTRRIPLASLRGQVAYSRGGDIWTGAADGSNRRRLARPGLEEDPTWSPDRRRLAYRDSRRGINLNDEIYVMSRDGSRRRNLTNSPYTNDWGPAWSPDGKLIAFNSGFELHVMRPNGQGRRRITGIEAEYPTWSPDGRRLAFMSIQPHATGSDPNYDIYVVNLDGTGLRRLTDWPGQDGWPAWSPDGRSIAYTTSQDSAGQFRGRGPYLDIYLMRPDGSDKRRVVHHSFGAFPDWSPDGELIMFTGSPLSRRGNASGSFDRTVPASGRCRSTGRSPTGRGRERSYETECASGAQGYFTISRETIPPCQCPSTPQ
jgi:TolB protein